jgi:3-dehydroquinate dehydratase/shikimate dehydrogenase
VKGKFIAIPIASRRLEEAIERVSQAERLCDVIEFRLDYLSDLSLDDPVADVNRLIEATRSAIILTRHLSRRRQDEPDSDFHQQVVFWKSLFSLGHRRPIYFDLDLKLAEWFSSAQDPVPWDQVIVSYHNFDETPAALPEIYRRMAATPAAIFKIATQAQDISDNIRLFALLNQAKRESRPMICLGMGEAGVMSRILSLAWGGLITFASLSADEQTAPGQLAADELQHLYRVRALTMESKITGIIGGSVRHSLSPLLHNGAYRHLGLDWVYLPLLVKDLRQFMTEYVIPPTRRMNWDLRGLSVTIPHKVEILKYLDRVDSMAEQIGAVNTLVVEDGRLVGYNTDVEGAMRPLLQRLDLRGSRAVVLGAGGAARAVGFGLAREGADLRILARNPAQARELAIRLGGTSGSLQDLAEDEYDVLINATPLGMGDSPDETPVPVHRLRSGTIVFDLVARRPETKLLRDARAAGCHTISGLEMLVYQAVGQFERWTNLKAPVEVLFQAVWPALE